MRLPILTVSLFLALAASAAVAGNRVPIVPESALPEHWVLAPGVVRAIPGFPTGGDHAKDVCVTVGFQVTNTGETSNFSELKSWTSTTGAAIPPAETVAPYVQAAAAAVSLWKFAPVGRARSVYTAATFAFPGGAGDAVALRPNCEIADLLDFINQAQAEAQRRGDGVKARLEKAQRDVPVYNPLLKN
jgi:hypothetical protein